MIMRYKLIAGVAISGLAFHLFMIFVNLGPPNLLKLHFGPFAHQYMHRFFYQNWHLFSPNPAISSSKFAVRCADDEGQWSSWKDPFAGLQERHQLTRITGYGKVLMLFGDIAHSLKQAASAGMKPCEGADCEEERQITRRIQEQAQDLATRFSIIYCRERHPERPASLSAIQYKILEFFPVQFTERGQAQQKWEKVIELPFEPITWPKAGGRS
jgi:hypothetical protein